MFLRPRLFNKVAVIFCSVRACSHVSNNFQPAKKDSIVSHKKSGWNDAVKNAEKIVGYSTSFINLRWLLSDEVANVAQHLKKLVGVDHPILHTAKSIICNEQSNTQSWGLVILLLSKAAGHRDCIKSHDIENDQRVLAELTEIIRMGNLVHKGLVNIYPEEKPKEGTTFGNKLGLLVGDYLLVTANGMLAKLKNQHVSSLVAAALRDLSEGEFVGDRDPQNFPLPTKPKSIVFKANAIEVWTDPQSGPMNAEEALGYASKEWIVRNVLSGGSLLGRACEGVLAISGHSEEIQKQGYYLGCYLALTFRAREEITSAKSLGAKLSLVSAPVLFALENDPSLYDKIIVDAQIGIRNVNYKYLRDAIISGPALQRTDALCTDYLERSIEIVSNILPKSDISRTLEKLIVTAASCS